MELEKQSIPPPEKIAEIDETRILSDKELLDGGANYARDQKDGSKRLEVTSDQMKTEVEKITEQDKNKTSSDAKMIKEGAHYVRDLKDDNARLEATPGQLYDVLREMHLDQIKNASNWEELFKTLKDMSEEHIGSVLMIHDYIERKDYHTSEIITAINNLRAYGIHGKGEHATLKIPDIGSLKDKVCELLNETNILGKYNRYRWDEDRINLEDIHDSIA
jgi:hypothetical protein